MIVDIPTSIGELVDKVTILQIKNKKIVDMIKLKNVQFELHLLTEKLKSLKTYDFSKSMVSLYAVNSELWTIEDNIRQKEKLNQFDDEFIQLARAVYYKNDERAQLKKEINSIVGSTIIEEKLYDDYR
jgi:hypothetical protein